MMDPNTDFFSSYQAVNSKLKKRFLKKPNLSEAREQFYQLAKSLYHNGVPQYAGFCCLAMARCEQSMVNAAGEIKALVDAGRHFLQADKSLEDMHCPNYHEHLSWAKHCFEQAIKIYIATDLSIMAAALCEEMGAYLEKDDQHRDALPYYERAAELYFQNPLLNLKAEEKVMHLKILTGEHQSALSTGVEILQQIVEKGAYKSDKVTLLGGFLELQCECEVTVVLLLMFLDIHPLKMKREHSLILQKYTWTNTDTDEMANISGGMNEDLFILLQSVVMACSSKDIDSLKYLQNEIRRYFTPQQNMLLSRIIEEFQHPSGLGF